MEQLRLTPNSRKPPIIRGFLLGAEGGSRTHTPFGKAF